MTRVAKSDAITLALIGLALVMTLLAWRNTQLTPRPESPSRIPEWDELTRIATWLQLDSSEPVHSRPYDRSLLLFIRVDCLECTEILRFLELNSNSVGSRVNIGLLHFPDTAEASFAAAAAFECVALDGAVRLQGAFPGQADATLDGDFIGHVIRGSARLRDGACISGLGRRIVDRHYSAARQLGLRRLPVLIHEGIVIHPPHTPLLLDSLLKL